MGGNSSTWRTELIARVPWVERLDLPVTCDQYRWSAMPLKAVYRPKLGLKEKYRCKNHAYWKLTGLDSGSPINKFDSLHMGKSGVYCYSHFVNQAFIPDLEWARWQAWCEENSELIERIKSGVEPRMIKRMRKNAHHEVSDEA